MTPRIAFTTSPLRPLRLVRPTCLILNSYRVLAYVPETRIGEVRCTQTRLRYVKHWYGLQLRGRKR